MRSTTARQKPQDPGTRAGYALQSTLGLATLPPKLELPAWKNATGKYKDDYSDEWARYLNHPVSPDRQVNTFTIVISDGKNPDYEQLMVSMARQGGGEAIVIDQSKADVSALSDALLRALYQMQATNGVFAAPVLPVSANSQGTYKNQIFMGMFRPDGSANPRWVGNLKQFQFGQRTTNENKVELFLADANGDSAINPVTGFISPTAVSFWSSKDPGQLPDSKGGFWSTEYRQRIGAADGFDAPDGQFVEKGGVGQRERMKHLSSMKTRNVYTCLDAKCTAGASLSTMSFDTTNLTPAQLGVTTNTEATNLVNWVRGLDTAAVNGDTAAGPESNIPPANVPPPNNTATLPVQVRGTIHGDVLHSRPAVVDYGGTLGTVVFYGANDGMFRAINGNQTAAACSSLGVKPGEPLWAFVAPEHFPQLKKIYSNKPPLTLGSPTGSGKPYFFDGSPTVYRDAASGKVYMYLTARRGGRLMYALDVTDPKAPKFLWKRSNTDTGFSELGQTWSAPAVGKVKGHSNPVLIFGAGYDPNQDDEATTAADTMGRGIFVLDAVTGAKVWEAGPGGNGDTCKGNPCHLENMKHAIPAEIANLNRDFDLEGYVDRLYAADTGGNVWRVDLEPDGTGAVSTWQVSKLAALGGSTTPRRKFFYPPDVAPGKDYDAVVMISGDREHPTVYDDATFGVQNRFYMIKDQFPGKDGSQGVPAVDNTDTARDDDVADLVRITIDATTGKSSPTYSGTLKGFFYTLPTTARKASTRRRPSAAPCISAPTSPRQRIRTPARLAWAQHAATTSTTSQVTSSRSTSSAAACPRRRW